MRQAVNRGSSCSTHLRDAIVIAGLLLTACTSVHDHLKDTVSAGRYAEAIAYGDEWLASDDAKDEPGLADKVLLLVARARFDLAARHDSVQAYRAFRDWAGGDTRFKDLAWTAWAAESRARYRDDVLPSPSVEAYRAFRHEYPLAADEADSKRREAALALEHAPADGMLQALRQWRARYEKWPEAVESTRRARGAEVELALAAARADGSVSGLKAFRLDYEYWPEARAPIATVRSLEVVAALAEAEAAATSSGLRQLLEEYGAWPEATDIIPRVRRLEVEFSFSEAVAESGLEALEHFLSTRDDPRWQAKARAAIADRVLGPMVSSMEKGGLPADRAINAFLRAHGARRGLAAAARPYRAAAWHAAQKRESIAGFRLFKRLFPDVPEAAEAQKREADLAWRDASESAHPDSWLGFAEEYPADPRAAGAEVRHAALQRKQLATTTWPRATISVERRLPNGDLELYVDVRDCTGTLVSGLKQRVFDVVVGDDAAEVIDFSGLEEDRPVDLVFLIDLSGSMEVERAAVHAAVTEFAERLRYRGRAARAGLISYGTQIETVHPPTTDMRAFVRWMEQLPDTAGGLAEDSVAAMLRAAKLPLRRDAERVVVLITDEELQLGLKSSGIRLAQCLPWRKARPDCSHCGMDTNCWHRCSSRPARLVPRKIHPKCHQLGALRFGSKEMQGLVRTLGRKKLRLFMLVPPTDHETGEEILGFDELAERAGGEVLQVPQDADRPGPYEQALRVISERLSKQYVLRVKKPRSGTTPVVAVRPMHLWRNVGKLPLGRLVGLFPLGGTASCPRLLYVTRRGEIYESTGCGSAWREIALPVPRTSIADAVHDGDRVLVRADDGTLLEVTGKPASASRLQGDTLFVAAQPGAGTWSVSTVGGAAAVIGPSANGAPPRPPTPLPAVPLAFLATPQRACAYLSSNRRVCINRADGALQDEEVFGLAGAVLAPRAQAMVAPGRERVILLAAADGAVHRSIDGGRHWTQALPSDTAPRHLSQVEGVRPLVCVAGPSGVLCSDDAGLSFRQVGDSHGATDPTSLASDGRRVYLARARDLQRLDQIAGRDIPSSNIYFATGSDRPSRAMLHFLDELIGALRADPDLELRVEGHADRRGSDADNEELALRRARAVAAYVLAAGVAKDRLEVLSFGERRPVRSGASAADLARNRRVELVTLRLTPAGGWDADPCATYADDEEVPDEVTEPAQGEVSGVKLGPGSGGLGTSEASRGGKFEMSGSQTRGVCNEDHVKSVVRRRAGAIRACYESRLQLNARLAGELGVTWAISSDGSSSRIRVTSDSLGDQKATDCILPVLWRMRFQKPEGADCVVEWTFSFKAR